MTKASNLLVFFLFLFIIWMDRGGEQGKSCSLICAILFAFSGSTSEIPSIHSSHILCVNIINIPPLFCDIFYDLVKTKSPSLLFETFNEKITWLKQITTNWVVLYGQEELIVLVRACWFLFFFLFGLLWGFFHYISSLCHFLWELTHVELWTNNLGHTQHINVSLLCLPR